MLGRRTRFCSAWSGWGWLPLLASLVSSDALARRSTSWPTPVEVTMLGPDPVRVRVTNGVGMPCDSIDDPPLIVGRFEAGAIIRSVAIGGGCVCFQQTYAPFSDADWSTASLICSACKYNPSARVWICPPSNPEPTIRIAVASSRQK